MANHNTVGPVSIEALTAKLNRRSRYGREWPESRDQRIKEVNGRRRAYLRLAYVEDEVRSLGLFRALDANNQITAETTRLTSDIAFVCDVDAASIASNTLALTVSDPMAAGADALEASAAAVWQRSNIDAERLRWALNLCIDGEIGLETIIRSDGRAVVVFQPFEAYELEHDHTGTIVTALTITGTTTVPPVIDQATGKISEPAKELPYRKRVTADQIDVWVDGKRDDLQSGENRLGVVPFSRVTYRDVLDGSFALWAGYGYDDALATVDSFVTQLRTLGTRHANPVLLMIGAMITDGEQLQEAGRTLSVGKDADVRWLEAGLTAVKALLETSIEVRQRCVETLPEFLFVDSGGNASGTALSYRALAFTAKIDPIRSRFYAGLARQIGMATYADLGLPWSDEVKPIQVSGGPAIPQDVATLAKLYSDLREAGAITNADLARQLQAMGIASDDVSPAEYAAMALAEQIARQGGTSEMISKLQALLEALNAGGALPADTASQTAGAQATDQTTPNAAPPEPTNSQPA